MRLSLSGSGRILVRLPAWLGDFVMSEPAVRGLAEHLGEWRLSLAGRAEHLELLEGRFPAARRIPLRDSVGEDARAWRGHELALLCSGSFRSAWTAVRAGIPRRVGSSRDGRALLLTDRLAPASERGGTPHGLGRPGGGRRRLPRPLERTLAELLGLVGVPVRDLRPRIEVRESWLVAARARRERLGLRRDGPFLLANVGARAGSAKGCPPELWGRVLGDCLRRSDLPLVLVAGPGEERALAAAGAALGDEPARVFPLVDPAARLPELAAHCAEASAVLTSDSGPRHVARAVGAPLVVLAGPTDPRHTAGQGARERLLRVSVPCGPCHRERCPFTGPENQRCMREIAPEAVGAALRELLEESARPPQSRPAATGS